MQHAKPSRTALRVAMRRATHQLINHPAVFVDPLALRILPEEARQRIFNGITAAGNPMPEGYQLAHPPVPLRHPAPPSPLFEALARTLQAFMAVRNRYAEDVLAHAVEHHSCTQYVLLGAGLDTFAYRNPYPEVHVFEVDHPNTQAWKLELLGENNIPIPSSVTHVPVDFEHQTLPDALAAAGFDPAIPTVFAMLGVVPYLTLDAFRATMSFIGQQPTGSAVAFDYAQPLEVLPVHERAALERVSHRVRREGEPFQLFFTPEDAARELHAAGLTWIEDLDAAAISSRYFANRTDGLRIYGDAAHILSAGR
jgi:methyltransferase (TIGR00027 family)